MIRFSKNGRRYEPTVSDSLKPGCGAVIYQNDDGTFSGELSMPEGRKRVQRVRSLTTAKKHMNELAVEHGAVNNSPETA